MSGDTARALLRDAGTTGAAAVATALGTLALVPVFTTGAWVPPVLAAVTAVAAAGLLLRVAAAALAGDRPAPGWWAALVRVAVPLGQLVVLACVLTALFAPDRAWGGWLPVDGSLGDLGSVLADGTVELREQSTPALPLTGLLALTTLMAGLVAVAVDLVAVGSRQPALAGLGLLVLFCVPVSTVTGSIGVLAVAAPSAGLALLLFADQHRQLVRRQQVGRRPLLGPGTLTAVRTGAAAVLLGLVVGALVPTLTEGTRPFAFGRGGGGGSTGTALDPAAALQGQLTLDEPVELLQLDASVPDPGHLRVVALEVYDADAGWTIGNLDGQAAVADEAELAALLGRQGGRPVDALVTALGHEDRFLPLLYAPQSVDVADPEQWRFDPATGTVFGRDVSTAGQTWSVAAVEPRPTPEQLAASGELPPELPLVQRYTALPPLDPAVEELVDTLTADARTPYERVQAVYGHFTDPANDYQYSLSTAPGTGGDDLADFLRLRQGYCEQYAGAMAALVRAAGVPARVVLGYTPGTVQPDGSRLVTSNDAHAWVEVYFDDLGWVPYDPTPIDTDRAVELPWAPRAPDQELDPRTDPLPAPLPAPAPRAPQELPVPQELPAPQAAPQQDGTWVPALRTAGTVLAVLAVAAVPAGLRVLQRRRRLATGSPAGLWDELAATALDLGRTADPARTPRQVAEQLADAAAPGGGVHRPDRRPAGVVEVAGVAGAVARLARAEEAASYARPGSVPAVGPELRADLATARRGLLAAAPRGARLRALLLPPSLLAGLPRPLWGRRTPLRG